MKGHIGGGATGRARSLRLCLDVNVWIAYLMALQAGRAGTAPMRLVAMVRARASAGLPLQLTMSQEMLGTLESVLTRLGLPAHLATGFPHAVDGLMRIGPDALEPGLLTAGRDQIAMNDREDAGVLAFCFADRVDLLVTDNLSDFVTNDSERYDTQVVARRDGTSRHLYTLLHERADGVSLVVAHPIDAAAWLADGFAPTPEALRRRLR